MNTSRLQLDKSEWLRLEETGTVTDFRFEPAHGWKPSVGMTPEKERMKKLCEPVYEWVQTMK